MRSETYMSKINLQRGKLTVENRKSREKKLNENHHQPRFPSLKYILKIIIGGQGSALDHLSLHSLSGPASWILKVRLRENGNV